MEHKFWKNKPVMKYGEFANENNIIENIKNREIYKNGDFIKLPNNLEWREFILNDTLDITNLSNVIDFLNENYYYDNKNTFKMKITYNYLKWLLGSNGLILCIINKDKIIGLICGGIKNITLFDNINNLCSFCELLCVDKNYRNKGMSYTLIEQFIKKNIYLNNTEYGYFITNKKVPSPITTLRTFARPLNYKKIFNSNFLRIQDNKKETLDKFDKIFKIIETNIDTNYIQLNDTYLQQAYDIYNKWNNKFNICINYTFIEFCKKYFEYEYENVKSYVILDDNNMVVDFFSLLYTNYYSASFNIKVCHILNYTENKNFLFNIMNNILVICNNDGIDIILTFDYSSINTYLSINNKTPDELSDTDEVNVMNQAKFIKYDKKMHLNLFNYKCSKISPNKVNFL
jgi:hypothetical protein